MDAPDDPATAPKGMSVYRFVPGAILGVFKSAYKIENKRVAKLPWWHHRFIHYILFFCFLVFFICYFIWKDWRDDFFGAVTGRNYST